MKSTELEAGGERSYALVFDAGDKVVAELDRFAAEHSLTASHFTGLGAFSDVVLGFFPSRNGSTSASRSTSR